VPCGRVRTAQMADRSGCGSNSNKLKSFGGNRRHGVVTTSPPRMATADPLQSQPTTFPGAMLPHTFQNVSGATWGKTALAHRAEDEGLGRRNQRPIDPDAQNQDVLCYVHFPVSSLNNPALRRLVKKSLSTSRNPFRAIEGLAIRTRSIGSIRRA
jgi:hypothetical protein